MFSSIFLQKEVLDLFSKVAENPKYHDKKKKDSINYEKFSGLEQPFFLLFDAFMKYQIIIEDESFLPDFVHHLDLLWHKIDNFHDISDGVSKIIVKFCAKKLGYSNKILEHKKEILKYIYSKYIVDGYFYHGVSSCYVEDIKENGFYPQKYINYYDRLLKMQDKYPSFFKGMDFSHPYVSFTDSFVMACYYATYSPIYFSNFLCPSTSQKVEINSYARRDYLGCFKELNRFLKAREFSDLEIREVVDLCNDLWKLLQLNNSDPTIMMVKRSVLGKNQIQGISDIIYNEDKDIYSLANQIMDDRFDQLVWKDYIPKEKIEFVTIPYSEYIVEHETSPSSIILPTIHPTSTPEDGRVSFLVLLGSVFILLGVVVSIIMLYQ